MTGMAGSGYDLARVRRWQLPYSLHHTYVTECLNAGVQEYHVAKNMGTSVAMLEKHYGHTSTIGNVREMTKQRRGSGAGMDLDWLAA
jgi:integrase